MKISLTKRPFLTLTRGFEGLVSVVILCVLIVYPLGTLLIQTVFPHIFDYHMSWRLSFRPLQEVFQNSGNLAAVFNSLWIGVMAAIFATILGTITAFGTVFSPKGLARLIHALTWVIFFTPSYVIAQGWLILLQDGGILSQLLNLPMGWSQWFFTPMGLVMVMGLRYFPFVHFAMVQAIGHVGPELIRAARLAGAKRIRRFVSIWFPLLAPAWMAGASIAFAEGFGDFGFAAAITPQMQLPLVSYQIYSALNEAPVSYATAAGLSLLVILVTALALWLQFFLLSRRSYATVSSATRVEQESPRHVGPSGWVSLILAGLAFVMPVGATLMQSLWKTQTGGMALSNFSLDAYQSILSPRGDGLSSLVRSFLYALVAAVFTSLLALFIASQMTFNKTPAAKFANLLTMATIAVPGVVLAAGFVFAWNAIWLIPLHLVLYGTPICLALAFIAGSLPYAIRLQLGAMSQLSPNLLMAARTLGAKRLTVIWRIVLPLVRETAISTFLMTFTGTIFELPAASLLYPAGAPPFAVDIASKFNAFLWSQGAAMTIMGLIVVLGSYGFGTMLLRRGLSIHRQVPDVGAVLQSMEGRNVYSCNECG